MPLRNHFRPPLDNVRSWEELHGGWPTMLVATLSRRLPPGYVAGPRVQLGASFEIDVPSDEEDVPAPFASRGSVQEGGVAAAVWAPPQPTPAVNTDLADQDEYELRVYDAKQHHHLVAAVEIVSPASVRVARDAPCFCALSSSIVSLRSRPSLKWLRPEENFQIS